LLFDPRLSFPEKCRILGEPFIPRRKEDGDESAADFFRRRLGEGFFREIAAPLVRGVYMADPERLSMESVFPRFREAERNCGSLAGAFLWGSGRSKKSGGEFLTLKNGLEGLVRALVRELGGCELRCSTPVRRCVYDQGWEVFPENGEVLRADALCLAMNACDSAKLLSRAAPELSRELAGIRYDSIATVNLIYKADDMTTQRLAPGFLVPMAGDRYPFSSLKWLGMSPDGKQFSARAFISGTMLPEVFHEDDDALAQKIRAFLQESFGIRAIPALMSVERYPHALPQYETGHLERVARIEKECLRYPGLYLAGNGFQGFGITDCIARAGVPMPPARSRGLDGQSSQARTVSRPNSKPSFEIPKPG
jgi:oxygen-dependent protoporphyrinogen oxidase